MKDFRKYNDSELFLALKKNDETESAFSEIYARYSQRIYAYCLRVTGNEEDSRDIFQDTFLKFYKAAKEERVIDNILGFLMTIARNLCLNARRDKKLTTSFEEIDFPAENESYEHKELMQLVSMALDLLEFEYKEAFVLRQYHGLSYKEISEIIGESESAIKSRVWRAKEKIKTILTPYMEDMSK